ncbi:tyrosine-type recombinase/integrase [Sphingomonas sp. Leaf4]|uniref:tyrosine-type recombinase/integrase n=1 Tax=Sphingomonas sp. Leaf4 TaxID=2876553 RepID=UPI001E34DB01|nr:integrase family protein [Sphingomonas sp. Leaf4]
MRNIRLTDSNIRSMPRTATGEPKKFKWDLQVRGFGAYKTSTGRICFVYQYKTLDGRTTSSKIGEAGEMTVAEARDIAAGYARERRLGIDPFEERRRRRQDADAQVRLTIAGYFEDYVVRRAMRNLPVSVERQRVYRRDLVSLLGHVRLDRLTNDIVEDFGVRLLQRGPSLVRIGYGCLKALIIDAVKRGTIQPCEAHDFDLPKVNRRKRRLSVDEFARVHEAARDIGDVRSDAVEMILRTAKRKEEVAELPWDEINLEKGEWKLPAARNKSRCNQLILLPRQVVELLHRIQPDPAKRRGPVFTLDGINPVEMGSQVKDLIDAHVHRRLEHGAADGMVPSFDHWTIHDTRKVPATTLREPPFRYSRDIINAMLLHRVGDEIDDTYILTQMVEDVGEALQTWNDRMDEITSSPDAWPGGRHLPPMPPAERAARLALIRNGWPERTDQKKAREAAAADPASAGSPGAAAVRKRRDRAKAKISLADAAMSQVMSKRIRPDIGSENHPHRA